MMTQIRTLSDVCIFLTTALATHFELAVLLSKTLAHVWVSFIVLMAKVCLWPTFEQSIKKPHLALHSTLTLYPSFFTKVISLPFKTVHSRIASLKSSRELNSIPHLNLKSLFNSSFLNFSNLGPFSSSELSGSELNNSSLAYSSSSHFFLFGYVNNPAMTGPSLSGIVTS